MLPPAPFFVRKLTHPLTLGKYTVPAGWEVGCPIFAVHHSPKYYKDPERFIPERWDTQKMESEKDSQSMYDIQNNYLWMPFTAGPRNCQGNKLALVELKLALASLYSNFQFRLKAHQDLAFHDSVIVRLDSLYMFVNPRVF